MRSRATAFAALVAATLLLAACNILGPGAKPTINTFSAKPATITAGQSVTLSWNVSNATSLKINNGVGTVTGKTKVTVKPTKTTTYTLTATNAGGSVSKAVKVTVKAQAKPVISSFTANPTSVAPGGKATLSWTVKGATKLSIDSGVGDVTGKKSATVKPTKTTTYTLTATNSAGKATATVKVNVAQPAPTINSFTATPASINSGDSSTLSWDVTGATSLAIDNGVGDVTGQTSATVTPTATTTYTLTATNSTGSVEQTVTVNVGQAPGAPTINSFTANPMDIAAGDSSTLSWDVTGATSLSIDNGVGDVTGQTNATVTPSATTTYTLTASNGAGDTMATVTVNVTQSAPTINSFTADPATINSGDSSTLSWDVTGATSLSIDNGVGDVTGQTSATVTPTATTTYTLTATNGAGNDTATATVTVSQSQNPPVINSFTADPETINSGDSSTLSWDVTGATSLSIDNGVGDVTGQTSVTVTPTATTTYTLTATNSTGNDTATATVTVNTSPPSGPFTQVFSDTPTGFPNGIGGGAYFGLSVAVDGDTMVVGAPFQGKYLPPPDDSHITDSGVAYVYTNSGGTWSFATVLTASDAAQDDNFGTSVAIHGGTILVGAPGHTVMAGTPPASQDRAGAVYVFTGSGDTWTQAQELTEADASTALGSNEVQANDQFGFSVAIDATNGTTLVAGANQCVGSGEIHSASIGGISPQALTNNCTASGPGKAYVFTLSGNTWTAQARLDNSSDPTSRDGDDFSYALAITTDSTGTEVVAAGAHGNGLTTDTPPQPNANIGAVYLFTSSDGATWTEQPKLLSDDPTSGGFFGRSVALSGDTLLVGTVRYNQGAQGAAYVFDGSGGWASPPLVTTLTPSDAADSKYFGYYVALDGDLAVAGALDEGTGTGAGSVYVFGRDEGGAGNWGQVQKLTADDANPAANFNRVAVSGQTIVVGSPTQTVGGTVKGEVYVFAPATP